MKSTRIPLSRIACAERPHGARRGLVNRFRAGALLACGLLAMSGRLAPLAAATMDPAVSGQWNAPVKWPAVAVHLVMLHTGKVLFYRGDDLKTYVWDPVTEAIVMALPGVDIFCGGHSFLPDGRVLATGGDTNHTAIFDPLTSQWQPGPDMRMRRFYPTNVVMEGDGRTLVFSGRASSLVEIVESYIPGSTGWDLLPLANKTMEFYPRMHLLDSGKILHVGEEPTTDLFDPAAQTWQLVATSNFGTRYEGNSVALPPGHDKIMIVGGNGGAVTNTAEIIDMSDPTPSWRYTTPMTYKREHLQSVILPDGKVLVVGGVGASAAYAPEMFDPATETWTVMAPMATDRGYHSTAVLLPDGRVLAAGANGNRTREIYEPPYLFHGPRPVIDTVPESVGYGETFTLTSTDAAHITSVVFIRPGASTHAANMEQRYVPLAFTQSAADALEVEVPTNPNFAPPGYYMLFVLNADGVPSVAPFVLLRPTVGPSTPVALPPTTTTQPTITTTTRSTTTTTTTRPPTTVTRPPTTTTTRPPATTRPPTTTTTKPPTTTRPSTTTTSKPPTTTRPPTTTTTRPPTTTRPSTTITTLQFVTEVRVATKSDDAEEMPTGTVDLASKDLQLIRDAADQIVGIRFNKLDIPPRMFILAAYVQFAADQVQTEPTSLVIQAQAADKAATFKKSARNLSSRPRTTTAVTWSDLPGWMAIGDSGPIERTPNIAALIQEIVNRPAWKMGNPLALIITGTGRRTAKSYDGSKTAAPMLHVEFSTVPSTSTTATSTSSTTTTSTTATSTTVSEPSTTSTSTTSTTDTEPPTTTPSVPTTSTPDLEAPTTTTTLPPAVVEIAPGPDDA